MTAIHIDPTSSALPKFDNIEEELAYLRAAYAELQALKKQVNDAERVCEAVARGDLSQKLEHGGKGTLGNVVNGMVENVGLFAREVKRVGLEVGTEGKLGEQVQLPNAQGEWREITDVINELASTHTSVVRAVAEVTRNVALGNPSVRIELHLQGEALDMQNSVNGMASRLQIMAAEIIRVTREVAYQGKLGGQATVPDAEGVWFEVVTRVNHTCTILTDQVRSIANVATAVARGDLTQKIELSVEGEMSSLKGTVNSMVDQLSVLASVTTRVAVEHSTKGLLGAQAKCEGAQGSWSELIRAVNKLASNHKNIIRSVHHVVKAVALGNFTKKLTIDVPPNTETSDLKHAVNWMVSSMSTVVDEVTRVSLEVGSQGRLGGQADVPDVQGMWKVLMDSFNLMAASITAHSRAVRGVVKAVAGGDLTKKIVYDARGEMLEYKETLNSLTESLSVFANEITGATWEVGTEGKLGSQARVM
ncbi:hypothetical protein DXG01_002167 [Tephrocybe rancida]|nr:hypothetical protein DXG01_002167 [Tephrocybe rancida]